MMTQDTSGPGALAGVCTRSYVHHFRLYHMSYFPCLTSATHVELNANTMLQTLTDNKHRQLLVYTNKEPVKQIRCLLATFCIQL